MIAYMGCFKDVAGDPALAHIETNVGDGTLLSPSICFLSCVKLGYLYSATQNGFDSSTISLQSNMFYNFYRTGCFCGNSYNKHGYAGSGCSSNCALITQHICGGYLRNTVYSNTGKSSNHLSTNIFICWFFQRQYFKTTWAVM